MKLIEMAKHHGREDYMKKLIDYCMSDDYVVKLKHHYDGTTKIVEAAGYYDQEHIDKYYGPEDDQRPFVAVEFHGHEDSDIYDPDEFVDQAQVFELKRIK